MTLTDSIGIDADDDLVMIDGADGLTSPDKPSRKKKSKVTIDSFVPPAVPMPPDDLDLPLRPSRRRMPPTQESSANTRSSKQSKQDDDIVMVDAGGPSEVPGLKRSDSSAKKAGLSGVFGGFLSKSRPDNKRRSTTVTDDEGVRGLRREERKVRRSGQGPSDAADGDVTMSGAAADEDQEARREARRARRAEREAIEKAAEEARKAKDEERRERRRKQQEEEDEARRLEEKEARRKARKEQRAREEERFAAEAKEAERAERRRARRAEKEAAVAAQTDGEIMGDSIRLKKSDRRRTYADGTPEDDEERRRRHEERRALRSADNTPRTSRRRSAAVVDDYFDPRNGSKSRHREAEYLPADGPVYPPKESKRRKEDKKAGWPHSGTDSWVKDHSDAPPPPEDVLSGNGAGDETIGDERERAAMRKTRRRSKYEDMTGEEQEERRRRRESRRVEKEAIRSSEGSQGRSSRRDSGFIETSRAPSMSRGGSFWKKIVG